MQNQTPESAGGGSALIPVSETAVGIAHMLRIKSQLARSKIPENDEHFGYAVIEKHARTAPFMVAPDAREKDIKVLMK